MQVHTQESRVKINLGLIKKGENEQKLKTNQYKYR